MDAAELLPLFPLANVVLFPRVTIPLHLFEPRYRQLARDVLSNGRRIAMVVVRPEHTDDMLADPPIFPIGCCGRVTESQRLSDGRYDVVMLGEHRVRVVEELPPEAPRLYRVARVRRLEDSYPDSQRERVARLRASIATDLAAILRRTQPERPQAFDPKLYAGIDDATFVNAVSNALAFPVEEKQGLLEADSIPERFARLAGALSFQRFEIENAGGGGSPRLH